MARGRFGATLRAVRCARSSPSLPSRPPAAPSPVRGFSGSTSPPPPKDGARCDVRRSPLPAWSTGWTPITPADQLHRSFPTWPGGRRLPPAAERSHEEVEAARRVPNAWCRSARSNADPAQHSHRWLGRGGQRLVAATNQVNGSGAHCESLLARRQLPRRTGNPALRRSAARYEGAEAKPARHRPTITVRSHIPVAPNRSPQSLKRSPLPYLSETCSGHESVGVHRLDQGLVIALVLVAVGA